VTSEKTRFADEYPRERAEDSDHDLILFPRDTALRKSLFPQGVFDHPAKNNIYLTQELYRYLTEPGQHILDPFAGTGTLMLACLEGRDVTLVELEPHYASLIATAWSEVRLKKECTGRLSLRIGDCRLELSRMRETFDCSVFSPPFSTSITRAKALPSVANQIAGFTTSPQNMAHLNVFLYEQAMAKVFERLAPRITPGGTMGIISRDIIKGTREHLSEGTIRRAAKAGFKLSEWHKWKPPGSAQRAIQESRGARVVKDEDVLIFRKES
jgi:16S rRNA G966 N2-methylase RsmD